MDQARWHRIEEVFHLAVARPAGERRAFLDRACAGDAELRREVESLLAHLHTSEPASSRPTLVGRQLGPYQILAVLGEGGMGVVYRGIDTRLRRPVAIKVLPRAFEQDPDRLRRFSNEARAASALNHPHILTVYDIGEADGAPFIAMEFIDGVTLRARIGQGPLPLGEALDVTMQTGLALSAAHEKGIVHRDLKPENVMLRRDGYVKVLDFGLAALRASAPGGPSAIPASIFETAVGGGGTPAYMAPEQIEGRPADVRSDLFSFGVLICELTTGVNPFAKASLLETWAAISGTPESAAQVLAELPPELAPLIRRLLARRGDDRYPDMKQVVADLRAVQGAVDGVQRAPRRTRLILMAATAASVLTLAAAGFVYLHRSPRLTDKDTIVLADFVNTTGDSVFDGALRQGLAIQLEQSPYLSLVSDERIQRELRLMSERPDARLTPELAQKICVRRGLAAVVEGSIDALGSQYVLGLRARNCATGDDLDREQKTATGKEAVLDALSQMARNFRTQVGESLATVQEHSKPLEEATTPSVDALKAYSAAREVTISSGDAAAVPLMKRAVEIDPGFAMAHAMLGLFYSDIGESEQSRASTTRAYQLRNRASDHERFFIDMTYDRQVTGNLEREQQTLRSWVQTYPRDAVAHGILSGFGSHGTGNYLQAIEESQKAIAINVDEGPPYTNLASSYLALGRLDEAEETLQRVMARNLEPADLFLLRYDVAFLKDDHAAMDRVAELAKGKPGHENRVPNSQALALARSGQLRLARSMSRHAVDLAEQAGQRETAAAYSTGAAVWEAFFGNASQARSMAAAALNLSGGRDVEYGAALALALAGDVPRSQALADGLERRFPEDTSVRYNYLPTLRALFSLAANEPSKAIEQLQIALPHELAMPGISFLVASYGTLYPAYVRGEAYLVARQDSEAVTEFQKILDHRGLVLGDPVDAVARLQMGRAFALSGDMTRAKAAYADFLTLWKDADPDVPILVQAKAEYARLQQTP